MSGIPLGIELRLFPHQLFQGFNGCIEESQIWLKIKSELKQYIKDNLELIVNNAIINNKLDNLRYLKRVEGGICTLDESKQLIFEINYWDNPIHLNYDILLLGPSRQNGEYFTLTEMVT